MGIVNMPDLRKKIDTRVEFRRRVDSVLDELIRAFYKEVPYATHLMQAANPNREYYIRHTIETILRLRMKRVVDALAIQYFAHHDAVRARDWCHYCEDEMLHDVQFFVRDLKKVGVDEDRIYSTEPFFSTKLLIGYYQWGMEYEKTPLALIASVYFMEYVTTRTQPAWLDNLEKSVGRDELRGARAHVNLDDSDKHDDFVWGVLMSLVTTSEDEERLVVHLNAVGRLFAAYFTELYQTVIEKDTQTTEPTIDQLARSLNAVKSVA